MLSSVGLNFLIGDEYLLPLTLFFLLVTLVTFGYRATRRRGYGPLLIGIFSSAAILAGKFYLNSNQLVYSGAILLIAASIWNAWPRKDTADSQIKPLGVPYTTNHNKRGT
ncbi:MAG TPA: hypothetical protein ENI88_08425 [Desulfobulbus sp.]|nr:hypothetical protein [Desulfobulbus sp.]